MTESDEYYVDIRELHPDFNRYDCKHCGYGWIKDTEDTPNFGRCPECGWTQDNDYMAEFYGVRKVVDGMEVEYVEG